MDYREASPVGLIARFALYVWCVLEFALLVAEVISLSNPRFIDVVAVGSVVALLGLLFTAILVGIWIFRAMSVAHRLTPSLTISPGWAVGWYFVPFASFWKPYEAMREIWGGSFARQGWESEVHAPLLGWWWAFWLGRSAFGILTALAGTAMMIPGAISSIAAAILLAEIIRQINARQANAVDATIFE